MADQFFYRRIAEPQFHVPCLYARNIKERFNQLHQAVAASLDSGKKFFERSHVILAYCLCHCHFYYPCESQDSIQRRPDFVGYHRDEARFQAIRFFRCFFCTQELCLCFFALGDVAVYTETCNDLVINFDRSREYGYVDDTAILAPPFALYLNRFTAFCLTRELCRLLYLIRQNDEIVDILSNDLFVRILEKLCEPAVSVFDRQIVMIDNHDGFREICK